MPFLERIEAMRKKAMNNKLQDALKKNAAVCLHAKIAVEDYGHKAVKNIKRKLSCENAKA
jgi:hypothetical protein